MGAGHAYSTFWGMSPYEQGQSVIDCGDVRTILSLYFLLDLGEVADEGVGACEPV